MKPRETPVNSEPITPISSEQFPRYSFFEREGQEDKFLSPEELIVQTHAFMQHFGEMLQKQELPETIFFLDKSARPVAYMFRKLFPIYYPGIKVPEVRFINIGGSDYQLYDTDSRPFTGDSEIIRQTYGKNINVGGRITIVDEYSHTGQASKHASEVLNQAFPEATVTIMVTYDKLPNWYQNEDYLGVEEYTKYDYEEKAIEQLNQEFGTNYKDKLEIINDNTIPDTISSRFWEIYFILEGSIPYVKRGERIRTHFKYPKASFFQKVIGKILEPVAIKINPLLEAREELDKYCEEIVKLKNQSIKTEEIK